MYVCKTWKGVVLEKEAVLSHLTIKKGDRAESINFGWMEVVSEPYPSGNPKKPWKVDVRFDDTGHVRTNVMANAFCQGNVRDGSVVCKPRIGGRYKTKSYGYFTILSFKNTHNVRIRFDNTGNEQIARFDNILIGLIRDHKNIAETKEEDQQRATVWHAQVEKSRKEAEERRKRYEVMKEQAYVRKIKEINRKITRAQQEWQRQEDASRWLSGVVNISVANANEVRECSSRTAYDFKRDGKWVLAWKEKDGTFMKSRLGAIYNNMRSRGKFGGKYQGTMKAYMGVSVHPDFQDFQMFCEWATLQCGYDCNYQLDKDLLVPGNRQYGPDVCCFLPACINTAIIQPKCGKKTWCSKGRVGYTLTMQVNNSDLRLKGFESEDDVHSAYRAIRERYVKALAERFKGTISQRAYESLMKWELKVPEIETQLVGA